MSAFNGLRWAHTQMPRRNGRPDPTAKAVLYSLAHHADRNGRCIPGQERISRLTGYGITAVAEAISRLEQDGYLHRYARYQEKGPAKGRRTSDTYVLNLARPEDDLTRDVPQAPGLRRGSQVSDLEQQRQRERHEAAFTGEQDPHDDEDARDPRGAVGSLAGRGGLAAASTGMRRPRLDLGERSAFWLGQSDSSPEMG